LLPLSDTSVIVQKFHPDLCLRDNNFTPSQWADLVAGLTGGHPRSLQFLIEQLTETKKDHSSITTLLQIIVQRFRKQIEKKKSLSFLDKATVLSLYGKSVKPSTKLAEKFTVDDLVASGIANWDDLEKKNNDLSNGILASSLIVMKAWSWMMA